MTTNPFTPNESDIASDRRSRRAERPRDHRASSSWWKLGGTTADLDRAVAACVDALGEAHRPNVGPTEVTVGLRDCLRGKKWFPVGGDGGLGSR